MKKCPKCGEESLPDSIKYCYKCNYNFFPQKRTPQLSTPLPTKSVEKSSYAPIIVGGLSIVTVIGFLTVLIAGVVIFYATQSRNWQLSISSAYLADCSEVLTQSQFEQMQADNNIDYFNCVRFTVQNNSDTDIKLRPNAGDLGPLDLGIYPLFRDENAAPQYSICSYQGEALLPAHSSQTYICHWVGTYLPGTNAQDTLYLEARFVDSSSYVRLKYSLE